MATGAPVRAEPNKGGTGQIDMPTFLPRSTRWGFRFPMRWKLLGAFAGAFTLVFGFLAVWDIRYVADTARNRLVNELASSAAGGALTMDPQLFTKLITTVDPVPDPTNKYGLGYPDSPIYDEVSRQLLHIRQIVADAGVYSYYRDPVDGKLYFAASGAYLVEPEKGVTFKVPVADVVPPTTYAYMEAGLSQTTNEPPYSDGFGDWISSYSPIRDADGEVVGAVGLDYPLTYVATMQRDVQRKAIPVLAISYAVLLLLVLWISTSLTRPLKRLTEAVAHVADGDYDLDLSKVVPSRFPDEMFTLAEAFSLMAVKVAQREQKLTNEVRRLKVEIDQVRREEAVKEIVETDFFSDLTAKAAIMRARMREPSPSQTSATTPPAGGETDVLGSGGNGAGGGG